MNPDAIALFRELADRSPAEREACYAQRRVPAAVREEVESLLRYDGETVDAFHARVAVAARIALGQNNKAADRDHARSSGETQPIDPHFSASELVDGRFPPGTLLGRRYRIVGLLGRGGMGEVYRADDLRLGQPVALKFLPQASARDPARLARFHDEVRIARQVSHPNVCRVYDIGEVDGQRSSRWSTSTARTWRRCCGASAGCRRTRRSRSRGSSAPASRRRTSAACCIATSSRPT